MLSPFRSQRYDGIVRFPVTWDLNSSMLFGFTVVAFAVIATEIALLWLLELIVKGFTM